MKIIKILSTVMFSVFLFSCGGKNTNKKDAIENETEKNEVITDCNCSELIGLDDLKGITKQGSKELFTGVCVEKDQYDVVIREVTVKNGWLVKEIKKKKVQKDYVTLSECSYENGEKLNGWEIELGDNSDYYFVKEFVESRKGDELSSYNNWKVFTADATRGKICALNICKNGVFLAALDFNNKEKSKPKCFKSSETEIDAGWVERDLSPEDFVKTLDCLKSEFPHFNYWKK